MNTTDFWKFESLRIMRNMTRQFEPSTSEYEQTFQIKCPIEYYPHHSPHWSLLYNFNNGTRGMILD